VRLELTTYELLPFRIECKDHEAFVVSAGPDLAFDTEDDFETR
jgi:hypothetical protein